jgi:hypothetical protein
MWPPALNYIDEINVVIVFQIGQEPFPVVVD